MTHPASHDVSRLGPDRRGFTLFEVVVAITILAVGVSAVLAAFNGMNESQRLAERRTQAVLLARSVVSMVRTQTITPKSEDTEGAFEGTDYRFKIKFAETDWKSLYAVSVQVEWGDPEIPEKIDVYTLQYYDSAGA
jgi:type II secretion system protein I